MALLQHLLRAPWHHFRAPKLRKIRHFVQHLARLSAQICEGFEPDSLASLFLHGTVDVGTGNRIAAATSEVHADQRNTYATATPRSAKATRRTGSQTAQARRERVAKKIREAPSKPPQTPNPRIVQPVTTHRAVGSDAAAGEAARRTPNRKRPKRLMLILLSPRRLHSDSYGVCTFYHAARLLLFVALVHRCSGGNSRCGRGARRRPASPRAP